MTHVDVQWYTYPYMDVVNESNNQETNYSTQKLTKQLDVKLVNKDVQFLQNNIYLFTC